MYPLLLPLAGRALAPLELNVVAHGAPSYSEERKGNCTREGGVIPCTITREGGIVSRQSTRNGGIIPCNHNHIRESGAIPCYRLQTIRCSPCPCQAEMQRKRFLVQLDRKLDAANKRSEHLVRPTDPSEAFSSSRTMLVELRQASPDSYQHHHNVILVQLSQPLFRTRIATFCSCRVETAGP